MALLVSWVRPLPRCPSSIEIGCSLIQKLLPTRRLAPFFPIVVVLLGIWSIVGARPLLGYSNNYDFIRQSACMGLWPATVDPVTGGASANPQNNLVATRVLSSDLCFASIDNIFPYFAMLGASKGKHIDFRRVGFVKASFFLVFALITVLAGRSFFERFVVSVIWAFIFLDISVLLYFNTLYNELSVVFGLVMLAVTGMLIGRGHRFSGLLLLGWVVGGVWLGLSKIQYAPLVIPLAAVLVLFAWRFRLGWRAYSSALLVAIMPFCLKLANPSDYGIAHAVAYANITDTSLGAVLPAAKDKVAALKVLGLSPSCEKGIGGTWYTPGFSTNHPCPEVQRVSRLDLVKLFFHDPSTFFVPLIKGAGLSRPAHPVNLGISEVAGGQGATKLSLQRAVSISSLWQNLSGQAFTALCLLSVLAACIGVVSMIRALKENGPVPVSGSIAMYGGCYVAYGLVSSVFGDGYWEIQKHALGISVGLSLFLLSVFLYSLSLIQKRAGRQLGAATDSIR